LSLWLLSAAALIAIGSRTGKQCRERYRNHLSSHINHAPWSSEEDELGHHWTKFVGYLPGNDMMMMMMMMMEIMIMIMMMMEIMMIEITMKEMM